MSMDVVVFGANGKEREKYGNMRDFRVIATLLLIPKGHNMSWMPLNKP